MEFKTQRLQQQALRKEIRLKTLEIKIKEDELNKRGVSFSPEKEESDPRKYWRSNSNLGVVIFLKNNFPLFCKSFSCRLKFVWGEGWMSGVFIFPKNHTPLFFKNNFSPLRMF